MIKENRPKDEVEGASWNYSDSNSMTWRSYLGSLQVYKMTGDKDRTGNCVRGSGFWEVG